MYEIGDKITTIRDGRPGYIYAIIPNPLDIIYQVVWYEEDLYRSMHRLSDKILFWGHEISGTPKRTLKNGNRIVIKQEKRK